MTADEMPKRCRRHPDFRCVIKERALLRMFRTDGNAPDRFSIDLNKR